MSDKEKCDCCQGTVKWWQLKAVFVAAILVASFLIPPYLLHGWVGVESASSALIVPLSVFVLFLLYYDVDGDTGE